MTTKSQEKYACSVCGESYLRKDLAETCASLPVHEISMLIGAVSKRANCPGGIVFDILYKKVEVLPQTHEACYATATTGPGMCWQDDPSKWLVC